MAAIHRAEFAPSRLQIAQLVAIELRHLHGLGEHGHGGHGALREGNAASDNSDEGERTGWEVRLFDPPGQLFR